MRYEQDHDFHNDSDKDKMIFVEPGEVVRVTESGRRLDWADYDGEEFGNEVTIPPGALRPHHQVRLNEEGVIRELQS